MGIPLVPFALYRCGTLNVISGAGTTLLMILTKRKPPRPLAVYPRVTSQVVSNLQLRDLYGRIAAIFPPLMQAIWWASSFPDLAGIG